MIPFTPPERPRFTGDWEGLAAVAARLCADRAAAYPGAVAAGTLTQAEADRRLRVAGAIAAQWRAVADRAPMPDLQASNPEIRAELQAMREACARRTAQRPGDAAAAETVEAIEALLWHQQPIRDGLDVAHIVFVHDVNQHARATRATAPSNPGGQHVDRSASRAPIATTAAGEPPNTPPAAASADLFGRAG